MSTNHINRRRFLQSSSLLALSCLAFPACTGTDKIQYVTAETCFGKIRGTENRGIKIFRGVPYGANTSGVNRFMPPVDPPEWKGIRDTIDYGYRCPQTDPLHRPQPPGGETSGPSIFRALEVPGDKPDREDEECLVLNIWTPGINDGGKRPVLFWLHGGAFVSGSGSTRGWDGTNLCLRGDVVVITINHRLYALGFANFSGFSPDFTASGTVGMLDIQHALRWVQRNIEQFGGDPNRVTIFGQSGGGRKCETLLAMPSCKGLFHRAAIESGVAIKISEAADSHELADRMLHKLGIPAANVHKIRTLPIEQIMAAAFGIYRDARKENIRLADFAPTVDGTIIPQHPFHPEASAAMPDIPIIIGSTRTEYTGLTTNEALWHLNEEGLQTETNKLIGDSAREIIELYRKHNPAASPSELFFLIGNDRLYGASTMKIAERRAQLQKGPVYLYYFAWQTPVQNGMLMSPHNLVWPFIFDNTELCANLTGNTPEARELADKVSDAWIAFARTGDPNTSKLPYWPPYNAELRSTMIFNNTSEVINDPLQEQRIAMFHLLDLV